MKSHNGHDGHVHGATPGADDHAHHDHGGHEGHVHGAGHEHHHAHHDAVAPSGTQPMKDPVCGMTVTAQSQHRTEHEGRPYYFCSAKCLGKFTADPARYVQPTAPAAPAPRPAEAAPGAIYTCPMHPEIRQDHPGNCPKCGMTLEPVMPELDEAENPELVDFKRRFWWTLPLTIVVTVMAMFGHRLGWFDMARHSWIELALTLPIVLWAGAPFFVRGAQSIANRSPNMWTLIGLGTGAAFVYSVVAPDVASHLECKDGEGEGECDPEPARHVGELGIGRVARGYELRFERHAANGAGAGADLADLGVHRAGVDGARIGGRFGVFGGEVAGGIGCEPLAAARGAEIVGRAVVDVAVFGGRGIDGHAADRVFRGVVRDARGVRAVLAAGSMGVSRGVSVGVSMSALRCGSVGCLARPVRLVMVRHDRCSFRAAEARASSYTLWGYVLTSIPPVGMSQA